MFPVKPPTLCRRQDGDRGGMARPPIIIAAACMAFGPTVGRQDLCGIFSFILPHFYLIFNLVW